VLLSRVPSQKISLGKKIVDVEETDDKVTVPCSDNSTYSGTILVGADGAYSAVRSNMYKAMSELKILTKVDSEDMVAGFVCLVGVTNPLDPEAFPVLKNGQCNAEFTIGDVNHIVSPDKAPKAKTNVSDHFFFVLEASGFCFAPQETKSHGHSWPNFQVRRRPRNIGFPIQSGVQKRTRP